MEVDKTVVPDSAKSPAEEFGYPVGGVNNSNVQVDAGTSSQEPTAPQDLINDALKTIKVDDKGKFVYPEDMDPMLKAAVAATKSFRDTQSSFTKNKQELKAANAETDALKAQLSQSDDPLAGLSDEEKTKLAELKYTDPDQWYKSMKTLEAQAGQRTDERFADVKKEATKKTVEEARVDALEEFNKSAEEKLTPDMLMNDVPPRWVQEVEAGTLDFDEFLTRSSNFLFSDKVVKNPVVDKATNLTNLAGGTKDPKVKEGIDYSKTTF